MSELTSARRTCELKSANAFRGQMPGVYKSKDAAFNTSDAALLWVTLPPEGVAIKSLDFN